MIKIYRRSTYEIIEDILSLCSSFGGYAKYRIHQECKLSNYNIHLINALKNLECLEKVNKKGSSIDYYITTSKGVEYIKLFNKIKKMLKINDGGDFKNESYM